MSSDPPRFTALSCSQPFMEAEMLRKCLPASSATLAWLRSLLSISELSMAGIIPPQASDALGSKAALKIGV